MAKISRVNGNLKAFASEQQTNERTLFGETAQADDLTSQFTADFLRGWGVIGPSDQPSLQDFNALGYTLGQLLAYLHQMGIAEYNAAQEYFIGSMTQTGGVLYISLADANVGNAPASSPASWKAFIIPVQATESVVGIMALANAGEAVAGLNDTKAMTALKVKQAITTQTAVSTDGIAGSFSNLKISATGTSAPVSITADSICVKTAAFAQKVLNAVSVSPSLAVSGANGLDTGTSAASTWYSVWVIWNGSTTAGLLSLSATAPTMPAGYTHKARVGWIRTDATANKYPLGFLQVGGRVQYKVASGTNVVALPQIASGGSAAWTAASTLNFFPTTAKAWALRVRIEQYGSMGFYVAPSNQYAAVGDAPIIFQNGNTQSGNLTLSQVAWLTPESSSIYYYQTGTPVATAISAFGWEDSL